MKQIALSLRSSDGELGTLPIPLQIATEAGDFALGDSPRDSRDFMAVVYDQIEQTLASEGLQVASTTTAYHMAVVGGILSDAESDPVLIALEVRPITPEGDTDTVPVELLADFDDLFDLPISPDAEEGGSL